MFKNYSENLKRLRFELKISAKEMADKLGVSQASINQYETGKREPNFKFIIQLNSILNVNLNWFCTGKGEMFTTNSSNNEQGNLTREMVEELINKKFKEKGL